MDTLIKRACHFDDDKTLLETYADRLRHPQLYRCTSMEACDGGDTLVASAVGHGQELEEPFGHLGHNFISFLVGTRYVIFHMILLGILMQYRGDLLKMLIGQQK
jgi:hypothetical protein